VEISGKKFQQEKIFQYDSNIEAALARLLRASPGPQNGAPTILQFQGCLDIFGGHLWLGALVRECLTAPMGPTSAVVVEEECAELEQEGDEGREHGGGEEEARGCMAVGI
jgi:hypothetical protein